MLSTDRLAAYHRDGFVVLPGLFRPEEIETLRIAFERDARIPGEHRVTEPDRRQVRAVYASHQRQPEFAALIRSPHLLTKAQQLLGPQVFLYQLKTNTKPAFGGAGWTWHQDYTAWKIADSLPGPHLTNVALFLDEVNEFNGPLVFVPGSHTDGLIREDREDRSRSCQHLDPDDIALSPADVQTLVKRHGLTGPTGPAGTAVFFHPQIVHGSAANISPFPRRMTIITYNRVDNAPRPADPRPDYLVSRDTRPLRVLKTDNHPTKDT